MGRRETWVYLEICGPASPAYMAKFRPMGDRFKQKVDCCTDTQDCPLLSNIHCSYPYKVKIKTVRTHGQGGCHMIIKAFTKSQGAQEVGTRKNNRTISPRASEKARPCLQTLTPVKGQTSVFTTLLLRPQNTQASLAQNCTFCFFNYF